MPLPTCVALTRHALGKATRTGSRGRGSGCDRRWRSTRGAASRAAQATLGDRLGNSVGAEVFLEALTFSNVAHVVPLSWHPLLCKRFEVMRRPAGSSGSRESFWPPKLWEQGSHETMP